jgi:membrane-bound metal-dependent hydrolase YbcI (DUF457 family)
MKIPEHMALSFLLAQFGVHQEYGCPGTALMIAAGCLPDLDGVVVVAGWRFYRRYHRILGHGVLVTVLAPLFLALFGGWLLGWAALPLLWFWLQVALLGHLLTDVTFYGWPAQLLWPLSRRGWGLGLVAWNDLVPTLLLYTTSTIALLWPAAGVSAAVIGVGGLVLYLCWRAVRPKPDTGWSAWLTGAWAPHAAPVWRWLTGDFVT